MHQVRFLSHILYTIKMLIFRDSGFPLTKHELKSLKDIFVFAVKFNVKIWFSFRLKISAPKNDLQIASAGTSNTRPADHLWPAKGSEVARIKLSTLVG